MRRAAWLALGALALTLVSAPGSAVAARQESRGEIARPTRTSLLIPAKTKLIIEYSRIALA